MSANVNIPNSRIAQQLKETAEGLIRACETVDAISGLLEDAVNATVWENKGPAADLVEKMQTQRVRVVLYRALHAAGSEIYGLADRVEELAGSI